MGKQISMCRLCMQKRARTRARCVAVCRLEASKSEGRCRGWDCRGNPFLDPDRSTWLPGPTSWDSTCGSAGACAYPRSAGQGLLEVEPIPHVGGTRWSILSGRMAIADDQFKRSTGTWSLSHSPQILRVAEWPFQRFRISTRSTPPARSEASSLC
jgi:hypothetical protein